MTFAQIPAGETVFLDANTLIYHFANDTAYGAPCTALMKRIESQSTKGVTSSHVLSDAAHRLMTIEAMSQFGWPPAGIIKRLRKHFSEIAKLSIFRQAIAAVAGNVTVISVTGSHVESAAHVSQQYGLLSGDALIVAVM